MLHRAVPLYFTFRAFTAKTYAQISCYEVVPLLTNIDGTGRREQYFNNNANSLVLSLSSQYFSETTERVYLIIL